jgi:two-component system response regulator HydG
VFESELFGHERGAFTGAVARHRGRFERARGGTLFLDEIGELPLAFQAKLLTALQEGRLERLGGAEPVVVDVRVVAATNRDLARDVDEGRFRLDLYHRLRVLEIALPPLRERPEDVPEIVRAHLPALADRAGLPPPRLTGEFLTALAERRWPGNVRELLHAVERALVHARGPVLDAAALGDETLAAPVAREARVSRPPGTGDPASEISRVLRSTGGNVSRAARRLGVSRGTLRYRIVQHGLGSLIPRD